MHRRRYLAVAGGAAVGPLAGCLSTFGGGGDSNGSGDADGYGPEPDSPPDERTVDTDSYELHDVEGTDVPLVPIEDAHYWYRRQEARMADARGSDQYEALRIAGAALSTAPPYGVENDPVDDWPTGDRIITYCDCPHHLSGLRAAELIREGYEEVYALDEGFGAWRELGYPTEGSNASVSSVSYEIQGRSDPAYAGEMVRLEDLSAERYEAAPVAEDGSYRIGVNFDGLTDDSAFKLVAPDYTLEATLAELTSGVVTA